MSNIFFSFKNILTFFVLLKVATVRASVCDKSKWESNFECIFSDENFYNDDDFSTVVDLSKSRISTDVEPSKSLSTKGPPCRLHENVDWICDSKFLKEVPPISDFPKNLTRFILNGTQVSIER